MHLSCADDYANARPNFQLPHNQSCPLCMITLEILIRSSAAMGSELVSRFNKVSACRDHSHLQATDRSHSYVLNKQSDREQCSANLNSCVWVSFGDISSLWVNLTPPTWPWRPTHLFSQKEQPVEKPEATWDRPKMKQLQPLKLAKF